MWFLWLLGHALVLASQSLGQPRGLPVGSFLTARRTSGPAQRYMAPSPMSPQSIAASEGILAGAPARHRPLSLLSEYMASTAYRQQAPTPGPTAYNSVVPAAAAAGAAAAATAPGQTQYAPPAPAHWSPTVPANSLGPQVGPGAAPAPNQQSAMVSYLFDPLPNNLVYGAAAILPGQAAPTGNNVYQPLPTAVAPSNFPPNNLGVPNHIYEILAQTAATSKKAPPPQPVNLLPAPMPLTHPFRQYIGARGTPMATAYAASQPVAPVVPQATWSSPAIRAAARGVGSQVGASRPAGPGYTPLGSIGQSPVPVAARASTQSALAAALFPVLQPQGAAPPALSQLVNPSGLGPVAPWNPVPAFPAPAPAPAPILSHANPQGPRPAGAVYPSNNQQGLWNANNFLQPLPRQFVPAPVPMVTAPPMWFNFQSFTDQPDHLKIDDPHKKHREEEKGA